MVRSLKVNVMTERNAVIVGGRTGIGASLATRLLADGRAVWSVSRETQGHPSGVEVLGWDATGDGPLPASLPEQVHALAYCPGSIRFKPFERRYGGERADSYMLWRRGQVSSSPLDLVCCRTD
jgi:hypothetical protein